MRKVAVYGASALLIVSSIVGISYAQDSTTPTPSATEAAALPALPGATGAQALTARTWLGVSVSDDGTGVTIQRVSPGSPAETAKLQVGDVILSANGTTVETASDLQKIIEAAASGDVVKLSVQRGTDTLSVDATLATFSGRFGRGLGGAPTLPADSLQAAELILHAQLEAVDGGYKVDAVPNNDRFQLAVGDVITQVNGTAIASVDWATLIAPPAAPAANSNNSAPTPMTITLTVTRAGAETTLQADLFGFGGPRGFGGRGGFPGGNGGGFPGGNGGNFPGGNGQPGGRGGFPDGNGGQPGSNGQPVTPGSGNTQPATPGNGSTFPSAGSI